MSFYNRICSTTDKALNRPNKRAVEFVKKNRNNWLKMIQVQAENGLDYAHCGKVPHVLQDNIRKALKDDHDLMDFGVTFDDDLGSPTTITFHWRV